MAIHVEATGRDAHHVAEAAFKAVGRALRARSRAEGAGLPSTKGAAVKVAICDYGAGNVRSVEIAFAAARRRARRRRRRRRSRRAAGRRLGARRRWPGCARAGSTRRCASAVADGRPVLGICLGLQLALERDGGGRRRRRARPRCPGRAVRLREGRVPRIGWAEVDDRGAFYFAHSYAAETPCATAWSEGIVAEARSGSFLGCSSTRRRAAPRARATSACSRRRDPSPAPDPVPRRRRRPRRQGRRFQGLRDVGDPVELGAAYSDARRRRARLPRRQGDARGARDARRRSSRASPSGSRSRSRSAAASARVADADALLARRRRQGRGQLGGARAARARSPSWPSGSARRPSSSRSTPSGGRVRSRAGHDRDGARARSSGRARPRSAARARSCSRRSTPTARATGYDLELTRGGRRRGVGAGDRVGRRRRRAATSPRRSRSRRRRCSRRSCTRIPTRLASLRDELRALGVPLRDAA